MCVQVCLTVIAIWTQFVSFVVYLCLRILNICAAVSALIYENRQLITDFHCSLSLSFNEQQLNAVTSLIVDATRRLLINNCDSVQVLMKFAFRSSRQPMSTDRGVGDNETQSLSLSRSHAVNLPLICPTLRMRNAASRWGYCCCYCWLQVCAIVSFFINVTLTAAEQTQKSS